MTRGCVGLALAFACGLLIQGLTTATVVQAAAGDAASGLHLLLSQPYLPADFDQEVFDDLWTIWEEPLRERAAAASV